MSAPSPPPKRDLVAVIGTTGVGKSQLAIDLALALPKMRIEGSSPPTKGEIINSDSMQVYRGLDVITNKATKKEMKGVPHHLMGFLSPDEEYQVGDFQRDALAKIKDLHEHSTLPIAVGGTTYYLQNVIFPNKLVSDVPPSPPPSPPPTASNLLSDSPSPSATPSPPPPRTAADIAHFPPALRSTILSLPADLLSLFYVFPNLPLTSTPSFFPPSFPVDLLPAPYRTPEAFVTAVYAILVHCDPSSAARWHWRDIRKVRRGVDIVWEGRRWDEVTQRQKDMKEEGARFRTLIFWVFAEKDVLYPRLDARVDKMTELGLLDEINELWNLTQSPTETNYSRGIFQSIGYKEFEPYLSSRSTTDKDTAFDEKNPLFIAGLDSMKLSTRQYAKRQVKWIKMKLLPAVRKLGGEDVTIVLLDATDLATWEANVRDPAISMLEGFLSRKPLPDPLSLSEAAATQLTPIVASSEIVIISGGGANPVLEPSRRPSTSNVNSFPAGAGNSLNNGNGSDARAVGARTALKAAASEVIVLDDSDDDRAAPPPRARVNNMSRTVSQPVMPSSPELPSAAELWKGVPQRSYSTSALGVASGSTSNLAAPAVKRAPSALLDKLDRLAAKVFELAPAPRFSAQEKGKGKAIVLDDDGEEDPFDAMIKRTNGKQVATSKKLSASNAKRAHEDSEDSDFEGTMARIKPKKKKVAKLSEEDKAAKKERADEARAAKKALADEEKAAKKARTDEEKAAKSTAKEREAEEKKLRRNVNTLRNDKALTIKELTMHVAGIGLREPVDDEPTGKNGRAKKKPSVWKAIIEGLHVKMVECEGGFEVTDDVAQDVAEGSIKWTRVCDRRWEDNRQEFIPLGAGNEITVEEATRLVFITAYELSTHVANESLLSHVRSIKARLPSHINLFLMIHGLNSLYCDMINAENAVHRHEVRNALGTGPTERLKTKVVGIGEAQPGKETIEMAIMRVQIAMKCQIINTEDVENAIAWLHQLSMDVGQKPWQRHKTKHIIALGTADEKIESGKNLQDTYIKMLITIKGLTEGVAKGIVREYPTLRCLYEAYRRCSNEKEKQLMLVGIAKGNNRNGAATDRTIGASISTTVYNIFNGRDPGTFL